VNQIEKQHQLAVDLLQRLHLDNVRLEAEANDRFAFLAWSQPQIATNGQVKRAKRGKVRIPA
jgi:hypothetical protein